MRPPIPVDWGQPMDAEALLEWRKLRRLTQRDLAMVLGVTQATIARWEISERGVPSYLHLALESIDRRLSFSQIAPRLPRPARKRTPGTTSIGVATN